MTAQTIISQIEAAGIRLSIAVHEGREKLRIDGTLTDEQLTLLKQHRHEIGAELRARSQAPQDARTAEGDEVPGRDAERTARSTPHATADEYGVWGAAGLVLTWFVNWQDRPAAPFELDQARRVTDPVKFFQQLHRDIQKGPAAPRGRRGVLQDDILTLHRKFGPGGGGK